MIFAAILAGGTGTRMQQADMPKQFLKLSDKPVIIHTIEKFLLCDRIDVIYVGVHKNWLSHMQDLTEKYFFDSDRIKVTEGGTDRNSTIFNIIDAIEDTYDASSENIIVTHDAVRPFVTLRIINENIDAAIKYGACDTVIPCTDTIVRSENKQIISDIPLRDFMFSGQTPQSFKIQELKQLFIKLTQEEKSSLTDACSIYVKQGIDVHLVRGEASNMKITTVNDYKVMQALVGGIIGD